MASEQYQNFGVADFLADAAFLEATARGQADTSVFLQNLKARYPQKASDIDLAVEVLSACKKQKPYDAAHRKEVVWQRIENAVQKESRPRVLARLLQNRVLRVAALFAVVFSMAFGWFFLSIKEVVTSSGEICKVILPDGSAVTLNGNSALTYRRAWLPGRAREVWVTGEALFEVKHLNADTGHILVSEKFIVHGSKLNIEVLGTVFNLKDRNGETDVDLLKGKVRVAYPSGKAGQALIMKPGETLEFKADTQTPKRSLKEARYVAAWTHKQLLFRDASVADITDVLVNNYGYKVRIDDDQLREMRVEGTIDVPSVDLLLETLSSTLHLEISREKNTIQIAHKH